MDVPKDKLATDINVLLLKQNIQRVIWKENPKTSIVYLVEGEGEDFLFVFIDKDTKRQYSRITIIYE